MRCLSLLPILLGLARIALGADQPAFQYRPLTTNDTLVPRTLLALAHAAEVQREWQLEDANRDQLESFLSQQDVAWMRVRSGPKPRLDPVLDQAEAALTTHLVTHSGSNALIRLRQLELQAQRARALARPDVVQHLRLSASQSDSLRALFLATDQAEARTRANAGWPTATETARLDQLRKAERPAAERILTPDQRRLWTGLLGETRDTLSFRRTHPRVPGLIAPSTWLAGEPVQLEDLRGKVIVVLFYAFQCRNCQANFPIYRRWHERLQSRGVALVGIQSPETDAEKDPLKARAAAKDSGFDFPILFDPDLQNWRAWDNNAWPAIYLVDKRGYLRAWWIGELNWGNVRGDQFLERIMDQLRAED